MKHNKNKIIAGTILITLLLSDIGQKKIFFFLPCQSIDVLSRFICTALGHTINRLTAKAGTWHEPECGSTQEN